MSESGPRRVPAHKRSRNTAGAGGRKLSVLTVAGELLVTAGVLVLLYLGWQVWWNSWVLSAQQTTAAAEQSQKWIDQAKAKAVALPKATTTPTAASPTASPAASDPPKKDPPVTPTVGYADAFGVLYIPRFGPDFKRVIKESVDLERVLNSYTAGVGHYTDTQMPGEVGNFAVAGHDTGWGNVFIDMGKLRVGDPIYVQTKKGFYTYRFRNFEFVQPSAISVIAAVPTKPDAKPAGRYMTITTCNPHYHAAERMIAYASFDSWQPLTAGPPAEIAATVNKKG